MGIFNRSDCCSDRLKNFIVEITQDGLTVWTYQHKGQPSTVTKVDVPSGIIGDGVKVSLPIVGTLSLSEVQVYGEKALIYENVAFKKLTEQSSTAHGGSSTRGVDGNTSGIWEKKGITYTNGST